MQRLGPDSSTPMNVFPTGSEIRLEYPIVQPRIVTGDPTFTIHLHYRVINPDETKLLADSSQAVIVNRAFAETATPRPQDVPMYGNTNVHLSMKEDLQVAFGIILEAVGLATGLSNFMLTEASRLKWKWAVYAECALLSERVNAGNWEDICKGLQTGGWWLRVYLVETKPQSGNIWATRSPVE